MPPSYTDNLRLFLDKIRALRRASYAPYGLAPHKPILLLTLIDAVETGLVTNNLFRLTPELILLFRFNWRLLIAPNTWKELIGNPYRYLISDGFWFLTRSGRILSANELDGNTSIQNLTAVADGGQLDHGLWEMLQQASARDALRLVIMSQYFPNAPQDLIRTRTQDLLRAQTEIEAEQLIFEAEARFRTKRTVDTSEGAYIRHYLFPSVVKNLYDFKCAVCGLGRGLQEIVPLVEAAHIVPFSISYNDDPRNGLGLCKNHHAAFDSGIFSISEDYKIVITNTFQFEPSFILSGVSVSLPEKQLLYPAAEALSWHRTNVLLH